MKALSALLLGVALVDPGASLAGTVDYDMASTSAELMRPYNAPDPPGYVSTPFGAESFLRLEFDGNEDGVDGDVTIAASRFYIRATFPFFEGRLVVSTSFVGELTGGVGVLAGDVIVWEESAWYSISGSWQCAGDLCGAAGLGSGTAADWPSSAGFAAVNPVELGTWVLGRTSPGSLDSDWVVTGEIPDDRWISALDLHGRAVPEAPAAPLVAIGLVLLALGRRASGTMRRHEVA